jgi:hypothetical protein
MTPQQDAALGRAFLDNVEFTPHPHNGVVRRRRYYCRSDRTPACVRYVVTLADRPGEHHACTCPDYEHHRIVAPDHICKHIAKVLFELRLSPYYPTTANAA